MGIETLLTAAVAGATALGGFLGGKRSSSAQSVTIAQQTVELLQVQLESMQHNVHDRDERITALESRIEVLEGLVTQRADVEGVREVVDRIAESLGV